MRRSKLEKICFRNQTNESSKAYRKQKNYCRKLYRKERKKFSDNSQYVTKALRKAVIRRSKLEKICFRNQTNESLKAYRKQKNY